MAKFFLGQRVRLARPHIAANNWWIGRIESFNLTEKGTPCRDGSAVPFDCDCYVAWDHESFSRPQGSTQLEPILPEGAAPSEFETLADLLASLGAEVKA